MLETDLAEERLGVNSVDRSETLADANLAGLQIKRAVVRLLLRRRPT